MNAILYGCTVSIVMFCAGLLVAILYALCAAGGMDDERAGRDEYKDGDQ